MAGEAVVGALRAILGLDTAQFEDGVKKASSELQGLQKTFLKIGATLGVGLSAAALVSTVKESINSLEELNKASQKVGVPVEELSALKFAAGLADVEMEALSSSLVKLAKNMAEVGKGSAGPAADAFKALGIEVQSSEGGLRSQIDVIGDLADKFKGFRDGAEKTAIAVAIFGKAGAQMIPLLNQGREGLKQSADEAARFGLVVSGELTAAAEQFNDNLKRLHGASEGLVITLVQGLLPSLIKITNQMVESRDAGEGLVSIGEKIGSVFEFVYLVARTLVTGLTVIGNQFIGIAGAVDRVKRADFAGAMKAMQEASDKNAKAIEEAGKAFDDFLGTDRQGALDAITAAWERMDQAARAAPPTLVDATKSLENFIQSTAENVQGMRASVATFGQLEGAVAKAKFEVAALAAVQKSGKEANESQRFAIKAFANEIEALTNKLTALGQEKAFKEQIRSLGLQARETGGEFAGTLAPGFLAAAQSLKVIKEDGSNLGAVLSLSTKQAQDLNAAMLTLEGAKLTQEFLDPWTAYENKLKAINLLLQQNKISQETAGQAGIKAVTDMVDSYGKGWQTIASNGASAFKTLAEGNKKYAGLAKAAAIGEATVNTFVAATKALTLGPILGPIAAAAITAAGLAQVAKISATEFATGGSFKVGGAGGIDSQLVQFAATPGEMVDVRRPGQERSGGSTEIVLSGMRPDEVFTGRWLRGFVDALNQGDRDGYKLRFAER